MRRYGLLLPLVLIWGCAPGEDKTSGKAAPVVATNATKPSDATISKPDAKPADPVKGSVPGASSTEKSESGTSVPTAPPTPPVKSPMPPEITPPATGGFEPVKESQAEVVLASVEKQMRLLRDVKLIQRVNFIYPEGRGNAQLESVVKAPNRYLFRYASLEPVGGGKYNFESFIETQQGGKTKTFVKDNYLDGRRPVPSDILSLWPSDFSFRVVGVFANTSGSLKDLATAAKAKGWTSSVETKTFDTGKYKRVILTSNTAPKRTYSVLIDPNKNLPVELQMSVADAKKPTRVVASLLWQQSSKPLTESDLDPKVKTAPATGSGLMGKPGN